MECLSEVVIVAAFGLVLGSFATALSYRSSLGISWVVKRSSCPVCGHVLGVVDLIPLFSWCFSKGSCRYCKSRISASYPLIELLSMILCLAVYSAYGFSVYGLFVMVAIPFLLALFVVDMKHMILPNQLVVVLLFVGFLRLVFFWYVNNFSLDSFVDILVYYVASALIFSFMLWSVGAIVGRILGKDSLGFGDVKFFGVAGLWLGLDLLPLFMIISGGVAIVLAVIWKYLKNSSVFPFGPALISALFILLFSQGVLLS